MVKNVILNAGRRVFKAVPNNRFLHPRLITVTATLLLIKETARALMWPWHTLRLFCIRNRYFLNASLKYRLLTDEICIVPVAHSRPTRIWSLPSSPPPLLNSFATSEVRIQSSGLSPRGVTEQVNCWILIITPQQMNVEEEIWRRTHCV